MRKFGLSGRICTIRSGDRSNWNPFPSVFPSSEGRRKRHSENKSCAVFADKWSHQTSKMIYFVGGCICPKTRSRFNNGRNTLWKETQYSKYLMASLSVLKKQKCRDVVSNHQISTNFYRPILEKFFETLSSRVVSWGKSDWILDALHVSNPGEKTLLL